MRKTDFVVEIGRGRLCLANGLAIVFCFIPLMLMWTRTWIKWQAIIYRQIINLVDFKMWKEKREKKKCHRVNELIAQIIYFQKNNYQVDSISRYFYSVMISSIRVACVLVNHSNTLQNSVERFCFLSFFISSIFQKSEFLPDFFFLSAPACHLYLHLLYY